jgi:hypothetical protein
MNIHKNARTTPRSRGQIVARVVSQQESPATVATAVGVSERTVRESGGQCSLARIARPGCRARQNAARATIVSAS